MKGAGFFVAMSHPTRPSALREKLPGGFGTHAEGLFHPEATGCSQDRGGDAHFTGRHLTGVQTAFHLGEGESGSSLASIPRMNFLFLPQPALAAGGVGFQPVCCCEEAFQTGSDGGI